MSKENSTTIKDNSCFQKPGLAPLKSVSSISKDPFHPFPSTTNLKHLPTRMKAKGNSILSGIMRRQVTNVASGSECFTAYVAEVILYGYKTDRMLPLIAREAQSSIITPVLYFLLSYSFRHIFCLLVSRQKSLFKL